MIGASFPIEWSRERIDNIISETSHIFVIAKAEALSLQIFVSLILNRSTALSLAISTYS